MKTKTKTKTRTRDPIKRATDTVVVPKTRMESDLQELTGVDFRVVKTKDVDFAPYNPNTMEQSRFDTLTEKIKEQGGVKQTVLVRKNPKKGGKPWMAVDGEHRVKAALATGVKKILVAVESLNETGAKIETLAMNHVRGESIPLKLAQIIVDLQKEYSLEEIARMTGIEEELQVDVLRLLDVPALANLDESIDVDDQDEERHPQQVSILLMPEEHGTYHEAMVTAMGIMGGDVVPLVGKEVRDYEEAMKLSMGLVGVKLRNIGLALICTAFNEMPEALREKVARSFSKTLKLKTKGKKKKKVKSRPRDDDEE